MDLVAYKKVHWQGLGWIVDGLRFEEDDLLETPNEDFDALRHVYKHKATGVFLAQFENGIEVLKAQKPISGH